ncbi:hypothetical protein NDU88_004673 [Pleurodeles waltl]|uniref:Uncharacterized protein n=1 Tax=Pleurodeles waltl TaxID=8319 RepID=A0AAV7NP90_PLEWA|nr:hypothetical protein NDU88_004673 [Pleurodeles waltl]
MWVVIPVAEFRGLSRHLRDDALKSGAGRKKSQGLHRSGGSCKENSTALEPLHRFLSGSWAASLRLGCALSQWAICRICGRNAGAALIFSLRSQVASFRFGVQ